MSIKIHAFPPTPRAFKVLAVADHLGVDYEFRLCDLTKGVQKEAAFTTINPNQKMPVLEEGDFKLWESNAIMIYLAGKTPGALTPQDERGRADMLRWLFWESTTWDPACAILIFQNVVKPLFGIGAPDATEIEKGLEKFHFGARILDTHLADRAYVCDRLSLADFALAAPLSLAERARIPVDAYPNVARWYARMCDLPAWRATLAMQSGARAAA